MSADTIFALASAPGRGSTFSVTVPRVMVVPGSHAVKAQADAYLHQCFMVGVYEPYTPFS